MLDLPEPAEKMQLALGKAFLQPTQPRPGDPDQGLSDLAGRRRLAVPPFQWRHRRRLPSAPFFLRPTNLWVTNQFHP